MLGSLKKQYFFVFCMILSVFVTFLSLGTWDTYRKMPAREHAVAQAVPEDSPESFSPSRAP